MICGGALGGLTQTAMNTVLPDVMGELGISMSLGQWLVTIFPLCLGVVIPLVAFLSRRFSARMLFMCAVLSFMCGSAIIMASSSFALLFLGRMLQGCATGIIFPLLQVVVLTQFPLRKRGALMGFVGLTMGFAPNVGPAIAGAFDTTLGWRSCFAFLLVFSAAVFLLGFVLLHRTSTDAQHALRPDTASVVLSTCGFGGLLMGFSNASDFGITSLECLVPTLLGVVCMTLFVHRQGSVANPLLDVRVFKSRNFAVGTIMMCLLFCAFIGVTLVIPLDLQEVHGFSALQAGMVLLPGTIAALIVNPAAGMLMDRVGTRRIGCLGVLLLLVGTFMLLHLGDEDSLLFVALWQTVRSFGVSALIMPITTWSLNSLPPRLIPDGTSMTNALRQISAALGTSAMVLLMAQGATDGTVSPSGVDDAMAFSLLITIVLAILCFGFVKDRGQSAGAVRSAEEGSLQKVGEGDADR